VTHLDAGLCIVRDWRPADKPSLVRSANNRKIWRNLTDRFPHPYTEAHADFWLAQVATTQPPTHWAIEVGGEAVGGIGADPGEGIYERTAHFGYWLAEPQWGRGIVTAAVRVCVDHVFVQLPLARLEAPGARRLVAVVHRLAADRSFHVPGPQHPARPS